MHIDAYRCSDMDDALNHRDTHLHDGGKSQSQRLIKRKKEKKDTICSGTVSKEQRRGKLEEGEQEGEK